MLDAPSAVLWSGAYTPNTACAWNIHAPGAIVLTVDAVSLEANFDSVRVYSSASLSPSTLLETVTGVRSPVYITAPSGHLYVVFTADSSDQGAGFEMAYTTVDQASRGGRRSDRTKADKAEDATQPQHFSGHSVYAAVGASLGVLVMVALLVVFAGWRRVRDRKKPAAQLQAETRSVELQGTVDSAPAGVNATWV